MTCETAVGLRSSLRMHGFDVQPHLLRQPGTAMLMLTPRKRSFGEWILANRPEAIVTTHRLSLKISQWCEEAGISAIGLIFPYMWMER